MDFLLAVMTTLIGMMHYTTLSAEQWVEMLNDTAWLGAITMAYVIVSTHVNEQVLGKVRP